MTLESQQPAAEESQVDAPQQEPEAPPAPQATTEEAKSFSEDYVKELRGESASYRKRAQEAEARLKEIEQAQMSELEKAQTVAKESVDRITALEALLHNERTRNAVVLAATELNFRDPADALNLIDLDSLTYDEETGKPSTKSVSGALGRLASAKPYLVGTPSPGTADGGAGRDTDSGELTDEQRMAQYEKDIQTRYGTVPSPV